MNLSGIKKVFTCHYSKLCYKSYVNQTCLLSHSSRSIPALFSPKFISRSSFYDSNWKLYSYNTSASKLYMQQRSLCSTNMLASSDVTPREFTFPVPYGHIAGKIWNEEAKVPVLCLHGWQDNAGTFDFLAPLLPKHLSLVVIDFPGHGLSSHKPPGFSQIFMDYAITVDRIVKHYGWKKVIILGHSMGSGVGMLYAGTKPDLVHSLILIDLIKPIHTPAHKQPERTANALDALLLAEKKILSKDRPSYSFDELLQRAMKSHEGNLGETSVRKLLERGSTQLPNGRHTFTYDLQIRLPSLLSPTEDQQMAFASRLKCRMLILKAEKGPSYEAQETYDKFIDIYKEVCSEFTYKTVPGTHHTHLETPEHVLSHIEDFLSIDNVQYFLEAVDGQQDAVNGSTTDGLLKSFKL